MALSDRDIKEGLAHLEHGFMQPQVWQEESSEVVTDEGTMTVPFSQAPDVVSGCPNGADVVPCVGFHWYARLSAPGYMDQTDTAGPFDTELDAEEYLVETYADDIDDCDECQAATETWYESLGRCTLDLTRAEYLSCSGQGAQDANVEALAAVPSVAAQLAAISGADLVDALAEYGAWSREELAETLTEDRALLEQRILWLACCDLAGERNAS